MIGGSAQAGPLLLLGRVCPCWRKCHEFFGFGDWHSGAGVGVRYATRAWDKPVTFRATVENAFNKRYWKQAAYAATLGMPRTLVVSSTVAF